MNKKLLSSLLLVSLLSGCSFPKFGKTSSSSSSNTPVSSEKTSTSTSDKISVSTNTGDKESSSTNQDPTPTLEKAKLFYYNYNEWDNVYCYSWSGDSKFAGEWPGLKMTSVEGKDNWFEVSFDATKTFNVIFNNGSGSQTGDIENVTTDSYFYGDETRAFSSFEEVEKALPDDPIVTPDPEPEKQESTVYYYNSNEWSVVNCYAWDDNGNLSSSWPGSAMEKVEGRDNWYSFTFNSYETFNVIFNNGTDQSGDIKNVTSNTYFYGTSVDVYNSFEAVEALFENEDPTPVANSVVYYYNSNNWATVNCHAWTANGDLTSWPGKAMTAVEERANWYYVEFAVEGAFSVIFNNGSGDQTSDIKDITSNSYFYGKELTAYKSFEEVEEILNKPVEYPTEWYLRGDMNSWGTDDKLTPVEGKEFTYTITKELEANVEFKVATESWANEFNYDNLVETSKVFVNRADNGNMIAKEAGTYELTADCALNTLEINFTAKVVEPEEPDTPVEPEPVEKAVVYYFNTENWSTVNCYAWDDKGNNSWPGKAMTAVEGRTNWYYVELDFEGAFNVIFNNGSGTQTKDITNVKTNSYFYGTSTTPYTSFEEVEENIVLPTEWYLRGDMNGWGTNDKLTPVEGETFTYTISKELEANVAFKIAIEDWTSEFNYDNVTAESKAYVTKNSEGNIVTNEKGTYTFTINTLFKTLNIGFVAVETPVDPEPDTPVDPEPTDKSVVYYYNSENWSKVNCYAWNESGNNAWPGKAMTAVEGKDNWYYIELDFKGTFNVIFNNGTTQTKDITNVTTNSYFYGFQTTAYTSFEEVESALNTAPSTKITVYFENSKNWSKVYCYAWGGASNASWPGVEMEKIDGTNVYFIVLDTAVYQNLIFNNGSGTQTVDIKFTMDNDNNLYKLSTQTSGKWNCTTTIYEA